MNRVLRLTLLLLLVTSSSVRCRSGGGDGFLQMFAAQQNPPDPCYEETQAPLTASGATSTGAAAAAAAAAASTQRPRRCVPDFVNAAFGRQVTASSTSPASPAFTDGHLTDLHNVNNVTCWRSQRQTADVANGNNVTLTLSLAKKYELTYISLQFCGRKPDTMAIYKSMDFGRNWQPLQYYSSQCRKLYGRPNRAIITRANEQEVNPPHYNY